jgi:acetyltransferase/esterase
MTSIDSTRGATTEDLTLHVQVTGSGAPVVLVPGAGGDAAQYDALAQHLSAQHTVVAYDRRNNGRNPRSPDWPSATVEQHADDLLALLDRLGLGPCTVYGNSTGALVALAAVIRSPSRFTAVVLHEPALFGVLRDPSAAVATVQPVIAAGVEADGVEGGAEAFLRFAAGNAGALLPPQFIERVRANAEVLLEAEFGAFASWRPAAASVRAVGPALTVLTAEETAPFFVEAAEWLAVTAGAEWRTVPGGHMGFLDHPAEVAQAVGR